MPSIELKAPAKINLFLHITGRRPDGYHLINTLFQKVSLWDRITLESRSGEGKIEVACPGSELTSGPDNLVHRAARLFLERSGFGLDVRITLRKRIPIGAGLGGGSSDAATVLKGLNALTGSPLGDHTLHELACGIGADVPFFVAPYSAAIGTGIGTDLEPESIDPRWYVLVCPDFEISSAWAYTTYELTSPGQETILDRGLATRTTMWRNDLERAVLPRYPVISNIKAELMECGAEISLMSGSGSAVFGVFPSREKAADAAMTFEDRRDWRTFVVTACQGNSDSVS